MKAEFENLVANVTRVDLTPLNKETDIVKNLPRYSAPQRPPVGLVPRNT